MAELAAQIRSRQSLVLKALPAPVTAEDRKALSLATEIARSYYPSDSKYLGEPLPLYYLFRSNKLLLLYSLSNLSFFTFYMLKPLMQICFCLGQRLLNILLCIFCNVQTSSG